MTAPTSWDVAVIGAGIAGLTAARTCAERGLRTVAYDALAPGGQLINLGRVSDYPGAPTTGPELAGALLEQAMACGVEIAYDEVTGLAGGPSWSLTTADGPVAARAVVVATGVSAGRLDVGGADAWIGRGLSECASCDGPLHVGRKVVVAGGDEWAAREAVELAGIAAHVTVVSPAPPSWSPSGAERLAALAPVDVRTGVDVVALEGDATLAGVRLGDGELLPASGVFVYTGRAPRRELLDGLPDAAAALWIAGDVAAPDDGSTPYLLTAAADGLRAGLAVSAHLRP